MSRYAVCLTSDENYLFPALVAASQARVAAPGEDIDIFVMAMGLTDEATEKYSRIAEKYQVKFIHVGRTLFGGQSDNAFVDALFKKSKFTFGVLGRLFLDDVLPPEYDQILYIDGDIKIEGSLSELVRAPTPDGCFLAAPDPKIFWINDDTPEAATERAYMEGIGIGPDRYHDYFNAGVIRINRSGWGEIGHAAWDYIQANPEKCVCYDQSALNAVSAGRRLPMSIKWNYPSYWDFYKLGPGIRPRITHFMSRPKPWNGAFPPWGDADHQIYVRFAQDNPVLASGLNRFETRERMRYHLQQRYKWLYAKAHPQIGRTLAEQAALWEANVVV